MHGPRLLGTLLFASAAFAQTTWTAANVAPAGNSDVALCFHGADGRLLGLGTRSPLPDLEIWERGANGWIQRHPLHAPSARIGYMLAYDPARRVVVLFGGSARSNGALLGDTWEWDSVDWVQRATPVAPSPRASAAAAFDTQRGRFVLYGGSAQAGDQWEWDGNAWTQIGLATPNPGVRRGALMTFDAARGVLVLFGGSDGVSFVFRRDTWEATGASWSLRQTPNAPPALRGASMTYDPYRRRAMLYGGRDTSGIPSVANTDVWEWDGNGWNTFAAPVTPGERQGAGFAYDPVAQRAVLHGGAYVTDTWELDPIGHTWSRAAYDAPRTPVAGLAANDLMGRTILHTPNDTHYWDHGTQTWQALPSPTRPTSAGSAMAFDAVRRQAVLLTATAQTWLWDEASRAWQQQSPAHAPPPTQFGAMAHDPVRARTVFFGGIVAGQTSEQVWEWDGFDWTDATPALGPGARFGAAMVFDFASSTVVMFGGGLYPTTASYENDVWDWNGASWTPRAMAGTVPAGRVFAGLAASSTRVLMVGGQVLALLGPGMMSDEVFELQGTSWIPLPPSAVAWREPALAMDTQRDELIVFGGTVNAPQGSHTEGVWVFGDVRAAVATFGGGCIGHFGVPVLDPVGLPQAGNPTFALRASAVPGNQLVAFALGLLPRRLDVLGGCRLFVDAPVVALVAASPAGAANLSMPIPAGPTFLGLSIYCQCGVLDPSSGALSLSAPSELRIGR